MSRGKLIVFEGPEGGGKSTVIKHVKEKLEAKGISTVQFREPGGTHLGEYIRGILKENTAGEPPVPMAELMLFQAARAQLVEKCIRPAMENGFWVLMDRFYDSTMAYQGYGRGLDKGVIQRLTEAATGGLVPDLTFLLHVDVDVGLSRALGRNEGFDRFDEESKTFHRKVTLGYLAMSVEKSKGRKWAVIDASEEKSKVCYNVWESLVYEMKGEMG